VKREREREREREKLETENKEEERCNKLDRRERSCFSILTTKKHIHLNEKNISILPLLVRKRATCLVSITLTTNNINNKNTFNKNVHRSSTKAHHDLLLFVRNNPKRCEKSAETVGKRNNDPIIHD
jgi:predicted component of viral defense system (DUF524 family)